MIAAAGGAVCLRTALVADDDPTLRALLARVLLRRGYAVAEAADGDAALRVAHDLADAGRGIAMLVSDVEMPGLDGVSLAAALCRVAPGGAGVPALLVSGHPLRPAAGPELAGVRFAFVPKPFTLAQLDAALTPLEAEIG